MKEKIFLQDEYSSDFIKALEENDLDLLRKIPKADLHNHFVLGGNRDYIYEKTGFKIEGITKSLASMDEMHKWNGEYIGERFNSTEMRKLLIEATFYQAKMDGVKILEIGEDVWGLGKFFNNDIVELVETFEEINERIAPDIELRLQIGLSRHCPIDYLQDCLKHFWGRKKFYSIDLYGDEHAQPIEKFKLIYERAKEEGLRLKAHIGEWGTASDVMEGVKILKLDEVQHGINAVDSDEVINFLRENNIRLNITPSSNILLGRVSDMKEHPIKKLYRSGADVTVNSDDVLIFDSDVSKEYMRLYKLGCLNTKELDDIRINGLKK